MPYVILSFIGDYPVDKQPYWNEQYDKLITAIKYAKIQHDILTHKHEDLYTIVTEKDNYEVVFWIKYKKLEIKDKVKATKLADERY
jgi:uncharacterized protein YbaA (DUF1428 family)